MPRISLKNFSISFKKFPNMPKVVARVPWEASQISLKSTSYFSAKKSLASPQHFLGKFHELYCRNRPSFLEGPRTFWRKAHELSRKLTNFFENFSRSFSGIFFETFGELPWISWRSSPSLSTDVPELFAKYSRTQDQRSSWEVTKTFCEIIWTSLEVSWDF